MKVVLATANVGKQRELAVLLAPLRFDLILASALGIGSAPEAGTTFAANAEQKARYVAQRAGAAALADDSGLEVDALDGRPGVYSRRYAGADASDEANNRLLLSELAHVPGAARTARYRCVLALVRSSADSAATLAYGSWEGRIATIPAGNAGFGYDPLFIPQGYSQTVAQLASGLKQQLSHRARASQELIARLTCGS